MLDKTPMEIDRIVCSECVEFMQALPDECIPLTITSPPYDNLRDYKGYTFNFEAIANQLFRITKQGGVVVWVVGDQTVNGSETGTSFRQALYFKEIGFNLHDTMIYKSPKPPLTHNRYEQEFEFMFILAKGHIGTFNPILVNTKYGNSRFDRPISLKGSATEKNRSIRSRNSGVILVKDHKIKGNIWEYKTGGGLTTNDEIAFEHPAIFPEKLAQDHILSWSNEGDLVFDPMVGSGTTCKMALKNNRHYLGVDISADYCKIAEERIKNEMAQLKFGF